MMSKVSKPEASNMTPQAEQILDILRETGDWMRRSDIAEVMDKNRLNVWDVALLDMLVDSGLVVTEKRKITGGIGFAWVYKAVPQSEDS